MTPAATKTTPSAELAQLEREWEKTYAALQGAKRERDSYDAETQQLRADMGARQSSHPEEFEGAEKRVKPDTVAAELQTHIRQRMSEENPHHHDYEDARDTFHAADTAVQGFRNRNVHDLLAEREPEADHAIDTIRAGAELLATGLNEYRGELNQQRSVIGSTPVLARQPGMFSEDGRIDRW